MAYYILVADTEQYAGNFEREMCAYATGQTGDCGVGVEFVDYYSADIKHLDWWNENVYQKADEYGCYRPVEIFPTEGWINNGFGKFIKESEYGKPGYPAYMSVAVFTTAKPSEEVIQEFIQRVKDFCKFRPDLSENIDGTTHKDCLTFTGVRLLQGIKKEKLIKSYLPIDID